MADFKPSPFSLLRLAGADTLRVLRAMPELAITALLIGIADSLARMIVTMGGPKTGRELIAAVIGLGFAFLLTPYLIAAHRFIVLGEVTRGYSFQAPNPRVLKFFGTSFILGVVGTVPLVWAIALLAAAHTLTWWIVGALAVALVVGPSVLCLRMTILLPAIAVDAPGANWLNAYHDTRGHTLGIFLVYIVVLVAFLVAATLALTAFLVVTFLLSAALLAMSFAPAAVAALAKVVTLLAVNAAAVIVVTLFAAVAARLYQMLGDRVRQPPGQVQVV